MIVQGMRGLGDNIYQRAFVRNLPGPVYLDTPWPELYRDLPDVHFLRPQTRLRTQKKNVARHSGWARAPSSSRVLKIRYGRQGIVPGMRQAFGVAPGPWDLPDFGPSPVAGPYAVVRPVTVRAEWRAESRNPKPEYVAVAARALRARGLTIVSVADLAPGHEWPVEPLPEADIVYHRGELDVAQLMALVQGAAAVTGGIGWIVPAAIAAGVPAWIIAGGQGGFNAPELITDSSMDLTRIRFALPDRLCRCVDKAHRCEKTIVGHRQQVEEWVSGLCI